MREIKFRAWDKENKEWIKYFSINPEGSVFTSEFSDERNPNVIPMQYTGLKDKEGKEIYEGDIVETVENGNRWGSPQVVKWETTFDPDCGYKMGVGFGLSHSDGLELEVVGNVYEDKKLLEGVKI